MNAKNFQYVLDVNLACLVGLDEAILLRNIAYWCFKNKANRRNFKNGRYWTYNTLKAYAEEFPFWTVRHIRTTLDSLVANGWIMKDSFNTDNLNRTCWYALTDKAICQFRQMDLSKMTNRENGVQTGETGDSSICQNRQPDLSKMTNAFVTGDISTYIQSNTVQRYTTKNKARTRARSAFPFDLLPAGELRDALMGYRDMRKKAKAPLTERAEQLALNKLERLAPGDDAVKAEIVDQSTMNGWKGLFPLKGASENKGSGYKTRTAGDDARAAYEEAMEFLDREENNQDGNSDG